MSTTNSIAKTLHRQIKKNVDQMYSDRISFETFRANGAKLWDEIEDEDYAHIEFLPMEGTSYRIIGTNYTNTAFPLIRYDAGDLVELEDPEKRCLCGRIGRLVRSIDGRKKSGSIW